MNMGISAECEFLESDYRYSCYQKWLDEQTGELFHKILIGKPANKPRLSAIIHEINECEVSNLLCSWGYDDSSSFIVLTRDVIMRNQWIFTKGSHISVNDEIWVSHIISPYGCCGSVIRRRHHRVRW